MSPKLLHIYGPFFLQSYGLCIAIGLLFFILLIYKDSFRINYVTSNQFQTLLSIGIVSAIIGGRALYCLTHPFNSLYDIIDVWSGGGFSILGSIIGVLVIIPIFLKKYAIP